MLNGIGGKTIAEAKENLTYEEFLSWCKYREIFGCLNPVVTLDRRVGELAYITQAVYGGKAQYSDFVPSYGIEEISESPEETLKQAMMEFK